MSLQIRKATRSKSFLKLVIDGVSGSGKTYSSLLIAKGLGERPLLIDTENGSGELYSHLYDYDYIQLAPPFTPMKYMEAINLAIANGNDIIVIDSLSHCWKYILSYKETLDANNPRMSFGNWNKAKTLFDEIKTGLLQAPVHVIVTLRAGSEYAESYDQRGNKKYEKVGTKPISEPDLEYEFSLALRIERNHQALATKDRTELFDIAAPFTPGIHTGKMLREWHENAPGSLPDAKEWQFKPSNEEAIQVMEEAEKAEGSNVPDYKNRANEIMKQEAHWSADKDCLREFKTLCKKVNLDPNESFVRLREKGFSTWAMLLPKLRTMIEEATPEKVMLYSGKGSEKQEFNVL